MISFTFFLTIIFCLFCSKTFAHFGCISIGESFCVSSGEDDYNLEYCQEYSCMTDPDIYRCQAYYGDGIKELLDSITGDAKIVLSRIWCEAEHPVCDPTDDYATPRLICFSSCENALLPYMAPDDANIYCSVLASSLSISQPDVVPPDCYITDFGDDYCEENGGPPDDSGDDSGSNSGDDSEDDSEDDSGDDSEDDSEDDDDDNDISQGSINSGIIQKIRNVFTKKKSYNK